MQATRTKQKRKEEFERESLFLNALDIFVRQQDDLFAEKEKEYPYLYHNLSDMPQLLPEDDYTSIALIEDNFESRMGSFVHHFMKTQELNFELLDHTPGGADDSDGVIVDEYNLEDIERSRMLYTDFEEIYRNVSGIKKGHKVKKVPCVMPITSPTLKILPTGLGLLTGGLYAMNSTQAKHLFEDMEKITRGVEIAQRTQEELTQGLPIGYTYNIIIAVKNTVEFAQTIATQRENAEKAFRQYGRAMVTQVIVPIAASSLTPYLALAVANVIGGPLVVGGAALNLFLYISVSGAVSYVLKTTLNLHETRCEMLKKEHERQLEEETAAFKRMEFLEASGKAKSFEEAVKMYENEKKRVLTKKTVISILTAAALLYYSGNLANTIEEWISSRGVKIFGSTVTTWMVEKQFKPMRQYCIGWMMRQVIMQFVNLRPTIDKFFDKYVSKKYTLAHFVPEKYREKLKKSYYLRWMHAITMHQVGKIMAVQIYEYGKAELVKDPEKFANTAVAFVSLEEWSKYLNGLFDGFGSSSVNSIQGYVESFKHMFSFDTKDLNKPFDPVGDLAGMDISPQESGGLPIIDIPEDQTKPLKKESVPNDSVPRVTPRLIQMAERGEIPAHRRSGLETGNWNKLEELQNFDLDNFMNPDNVLSELPFNVFAGDNTGVTENVAAPPSMPTPIPEMIPDDLSVADMSSQINKAWDKLILNLKHAETSLQNLDSQGQLYQHNIQQIGYALNNEPDPKRLPMMLSALKELEQKVKDIGKAEQKLQNAYMDLLYMKDKLFEAKETLNDEEVCFGYDSIEAFMEILEDTTPFEELNQALDAAQKIELSPPTAEIAEIASRDTLVKLQHLYTSEFGATIMDPRNLEPLEALGLSSDLIKKMQGLMQLATQTMGQNYALTGEDVEIYQKFMNHLNNIFGHVSDGAVFDMETCLFNPWKRECKMDAFSTTIMKKFKLDDAFWAAIAPANRVLQVTQKATYVAGLAGFDDNANIQTMREYLTVQGIFEEVAADAAHFKERWGFYENETDLLYEYTRGNVGTVNKLNIIIDIMKAGTYDLDIMMQLWDDSVSDWTRAKAIMNSRWKHGFDRLFWGDAIYEKTIINPWKYSP